MSTRPTPTDTRPATETTTENRTTTTPETRDAPMMFSTDNEIAIVGLFESEGSDPVY